MSTATETATREGGVVTSDRGGSAVRVGERTTPSMENQAHMVGWGSNRGSEKEAELLANFLAWFSIGLGAAQVLAPRRVARLAGVSEGDRTVAVMRAAGVREIGHGVAILSEERPAGWVWTRVAGDVMDLALLGGAMAAGSKQPMRTVAATVAVLGVTALDLLAAQELTLLRKGRLEGKGMNKTIRVRKSITIDRSREELYAFWRDVENLPRFMRHLESVRVTGSRTSHWKTSAPAGTSVEWDAEITEDRPGELIAWRSLDGSEIETSGVVHFVEAPGGRGTEVHVDLRYDPPGGVIGSAIAMLFGEEPTQQVRDDLRAFKQVMETGEIVLSDANLRPGPHPGMPPTEAELPDFTRGRSAAAATR